MTEIKQKQRNINSASDMQLEQADKQFKAFDENIKSMTLDRMNEAPLLETEPQTKLSQAEISKSKEMYIKPKRTVSSREKFNEKFRDDYNFAKEYVNFIAEHKELIGEVLEFWTKPFPGMPAEEWVVPTGVPVWAPRYVAENIKSKKYHRLVMKQNTTAGSDGMGQYYGTMAADSIIQRLDAVPANQRKSIFTGAGF
jgi:hypothetical protein